MVTIDNYTEIQPINFPTKGIGKYIKIVADSFVLGANEVSLNWFIYDDINVEGAPPPQEGKLITSDTIVMKNGELSEWGSDDNVAIDYVLNVLGLSKIVK
jgi:hypothetical protein